MKRIATAGLVASAAVVLALSMRPDPAWAQEKTLDLTGVGAEAGAPTPEQIEDRVLEYIAEQTGFPITSIGSVECDELQCEISLTSTDPNPRFVDRFWDFGTNLSRRQYGPDGDFVPLTSGTGTREIAPGAREYVWGFTYVAIEPLSGDPATAARQHAACAGAWFAREELAGSMGKHDLATEAHGFCRAAARARRSAARPRGSRTARGAETRRASDSRVHRGPYVHRQSLMAWRRRAKSHTLTPTNRPAEKRQKPMSAFRSTVCSLSPCFPPHRGTRRRSSRTRTRR